MKGKDQGFLGSALVKPGRFLKGASLSSAKLQALKVFEVIQYNDQFGHHVEFVISRSNPFLRIVL